MERMLRAEEVAMVCSLSQKTISLWYKWKRENPEHEKAKMLPDFTRDAHGIRLWKESDVEKLLKFKEQIVTGRNGFMGSTTQRYIRKEKTNGKKSSKHGNQSKQRRQAKGVKRSGKVVG